MGEVYRARDARLNRDVALKVLPASFSSDADRLRRFTIEAQSAGGSITPTSSRFTRSAATTASRSWRRELLTGETLRAKLDAGSIPLSKAVDYARPDGGRPRGRARAADHASRHQAGEPLRHDRRPREDSGLRPARRRSAPVARAHAPDQVRVTPISWTRSIPARRRASSSAPSGTCRRNRCAPSRSITGRICSASASCSTRCCRARGPSRASPPWRR